MDSMDKQHALKGRKQSLEHAAKKARKCLSDCTCKRHSYATPEVREKLSQASKDAWARGVWDDRSEKTAATRASWTEEHHAEVCARMSEAKRKEWAEKGPDRNSVPGHLRSRVSKEELSLAPYLEKLGYKHNNAEHYGTDERDQMTFIGRKVPDFVNFEERKVFEYFGSFWHPRPEEEHELVEYYKSKGWDCQILWDHDREEWMAHHG